MKLRRQVGGRYLAHVRGAFTRWQLLASGTGKPEADVGRKGATRSNVGAKGANGGARPWEPTACRN